MMAWACANVVNHGSSGSSSREIGLGAAALVPLAKAREQALVEGDVTHSLISRSGQAAFLACEKPKNFGSIRVSQRHFGAFRGFSWVI